MSGPKTGTLRFRYDPTPARLADLKNVAAKQDRWLVNHSSFIRHQLGPDALSAALQARRRIDECIDMGDADAGFDCYGEAWAAFNELLRRARSAKRERDEQRRREQLKRERSAARALSECRALWEDEFTQALLKCWVVQGTLNHLAALLGEMASGTPQQVQTKARSWQREFDHVRAAAVRASEQNAQDVRECMPRLRQAIERLGHLNVGILPDTGQRQFKRQKELLQGRADGAVAREDLSALIGAIRGMGTLATAYEHRVRTAEFEKATDNVRTALSKCGYSVRSRTEADGTVVLQATAFPFKSVSIAMNSDTDVMKLDVNDEQGTHCVKDVQSLQVELARQGMELKMSDWGKGHPQIAHQHLDQSLTLGGGR